MKNNLSAGTQVDDFGSTKPVVLADPPPCVRFTQNRRTQSLNKVNSCLRFGPVTWTGPCDHIIEHRTQFIVNHLSLCLPKEG